jgi:hypothetical protein
MMSIIIIITIETKRTNNDLQNKTQETKDPH